MWKGLPEEESIFTVMSAQARQHNAINLAQGFPNFEPSPELLRLVQDVARESVHQYAPMAGLPRLRELVADKMAKLYQCHWDADGEITITAGATQALFTALQALVEPGDEVVLLDPAYDSYRPGVLLAGARAVHVPLTVDNGNFGWNWSGVRAAVNHKTRVLLINQPHNPAGIFLSEWDWQQLEDMVANNNLFLLSDEVYEHMVYDGNSFISAGTRSAIRDRVLCVSSFGKTYHNTGWKVGYVVASEVLTRRFRQVHQYVVFSVNSLVQHALARYLESDDSYRHVSQFYRHKRDLFVTAMAGSRFRIHPAASTYFQLADYSAIQDEGDRDFCLRLIREYGVGAIPLSSFYHSTPNLRMVRFCFAKTEEMLQEAAHRLSQC